MTRRNLIWWSLLASCGVLALSSCANSEPSLVDTTSTASVYKRAEIPPPPALPKKPSSKSLELLVEEVVLARSSQLGATLDSTEWRNLRRVICENLAAGGPGLYLSQTANALQSQRQWMFTDLYLDGAIEGTCVTAKKPAAPPGLHYESNVRLSVSGLLQASLLESDIEYRQLLVQYNADVGAYGRRYGVDVSYLLADTSKAGDISPSSGTGYDVVCADGSSSSSGGRQGACSHHGGLR